MATTREGDGYPTLSRLLTELKQMDDAGTLNGGAARTQGGGKLRFKRGRDVSLFNWPGVGEFWLTTEQLDIVAVLAEAYFECSNPDVRQATLLAAVKSKEPRLSKLFEGQPIGGEAWGKLIIGGKGSGTYRLAAPVGSGGVADDEGVEGEKVDEWVE